MAKIVGRRPVEIKLSDQQEGGVPVFDNNTRLWTIVSRYTLASGSAIISGSQTFIGDQTISGSLTVYQGITGSLFGTASYADNAWAIGGNTFSGGAADRAIGTLSNHHLSIYASGSRVATFTNSGSLFIAPYLPGILNDEIFLIDAGVTTSPDLIRALSDIDSYSQISIQNFSTGSSASSDVIAIANNGSELGYYIDMGINNSTFSGSIGAANDAYLYSTGNDLHIGNASNSPIQFFAGGDDVITNRKLQLNPNNLHQMTGSLDVSGSITAQSFTGSLFGTASYAEQALTSSYAEQALTSSYAQTASYVDQAQSASYWSGSIINAETASYVQNAETASYVLNAISASYAAVALTASNANTASYVLNAQSASYWSGSILNVASASYAATASSADDFTVRGTLTAQTIIAQTITSSTEFITGSTKNGSLLSNTHEFTGSVSVTGSLNINGSDYITTSGSTSTRLTNLEVFSGSYNTGSFTGSFIGRVTGSFTGSLYNLQNTVLGHIPFFTSSQVLADSVIRQLDNGTGSYSIVINQDDITTEAPEALYVYQPSSASYNVISGKGNLNNYLQLNIQNTNTGENASSDVVATANNGNETTNYINMGINSEGFTGSIGDENDAYLYSTGRHLHIGTATNFPIQFFAGGIDHDANRKFQLNPNNSHELTGSLSITNRLNVIGGVTASLQGTASWANNAVNATSASYALTSSLAINANNATNATNANTASYVLNAISSSYATTASNAPDYLPLAGGTMTGDIYAAGRSFTLQDLLLGAGTTFGKITTDGSKYISIMPTYNVESARFWPNGNVTIQDAGTYVDNGFRLDVSGSGRFTDGLTVTGSFAVSGSTTQIGNNTLSGNTLLSGSIIISGSTTTPATPTIKIYGDAETNGVIKFMPVVKNIDTSVSASYIFVSGSTNDLYFSQNGNGYNNVTRLRWLEGNLYTGLLHGGLITVTTGSTTFNIASGSGIIVTLNASIADDPYPTIEYVNWDNITNQSLTYLTSSIQSFIGIDSSGDVVQQTNAFSNGQYNTVITLGTVLHQNQSTVNASITYPNVAYGYKQRTYDFLKAFGPLKLSGLFINTSSSLGLTVGSGTAFADGRNYQNNPNSPSYITDNGTSVSKIFRYYQSGSAFVQDTNNNAGYTVIDPANYNNNGTLTGISPSTPWTIQRVFWYPNSATKGIVVYYGNEQYASSTEAIANVPYEQFEEVENTKQNAVYLGAIVIKYDGDFTNPSDYSILTAGLFRGVGGSGGGGGSITSRLVDLSDVAITGPTNHQPLAYDTIAGKWTNQSSISASLKGNADTATTASFALTASYISGSGGGVGFPFSGSAVITGSLLVSSSFVDFTKATYVTGSFTGSLQGTSSFATTASHAIYAEYAGNSPGLTAAFTQSIAATTWSFTHNLNTRNPLLQVYDSTYHQIVPLEIIGSDPNQATIYFDAPESGFAIASNGGTLTVNGSTARLDQTLAAVTWSFEHNLATRYPNFIIYDSTDNVVIPAGIHAVSDMEAEIYFAFPSTGVAIANFSGISGSINIATSSFATTASFASFALNATSASHAVTASYLLGQSPTSSYALTASYVELSLAAVSASYALTSSYAVNATTASYGNNFIVGNTLTIDQTLTDYHTVPSSIVGSNNMFNLATGSYSSAFFKYTVANGANARTGEVMAVWNGGSIQFTDNSTVDIGDTSGVVADAAIATNSIQFNITTATSGWKLKSLGTFM